MMNDKLPLLPETTSAIEKKPQASNASQIVSQTRASVDSLSEKPAFELDENATFTVPVETSSVSLAPQVNIGGKTFVPKPELHVTVIPFKKGKELKTLFKASPEKKDQVNALLNQIDWSHFRLPVALRLQQDSVVRNAVSKSDRKKLQAQGLPVLEFTEQATHKESVIQRVGMNGLSEFYRRMKTELQIDLGEVPPAHITLMTLEGDKTGIGITSEAELEKLKPEPLDLAVLQGEKNP